MRYFWLLSSVFFLLLPVNSAMSASFLVDFSVSEFYGHPGSYSPPHSPIIGSISYEANSVNSYIKSILSIDLTIGSHTYNIDEIGFNHHLDEVGYNQYELSVIIGRDNNYYGDLADSMASWTDDFWIKWSLETLKPDSFAYTISDDTRDDAPPFWDSLGFDYFSITQLKQPEPVPEPRTVFLLGGGLAGLILYRRRMNKA